MATVDSSGNVVNSYTYDVFGETRSSSGSQANEFQFAGQQVDGNTGLQYLRARYYDMETGRFISRDPMTKLAGWQGQSFSFAESTPTVFTDPTGLDPEDRYRPPGVNDAEWSWCSDRWANITGFLKRKHQCERVAELAEKASRMTVSVFGESIDEGPSNAYRHCIWIGMCALLYGGDTARGFGVRHETLDEGTVWTDRMITDMKIDLHNNELGIIAGEFLRDRFGPFLVRARWKEMIGHLSQLCQGGIKYGWAVTSANDPRVR